MNEDIIFFLWQIRLKSKNGNVEASKNTVFTDCYGVFHNKQQLSIV